MGRRWGCLRRSLEPQQEQSCPCLSSSLAELPTVSGGLQAILQLLAAWPPRSFLCGLSAPQVITEGLPEEVTFARAQERAHQVAVRLLM